MADNNKVTIDAAWFADLYASKCEYDTAISVRDAAINERDELTKERDVLRAKLEKITKDCVQYERISESLRAANGVIESERADKLKVIKELNEARELNRKCCDENEDLKDGLAAAELCIEDIAKIVIPNEKYLESSYKTLGDIIRAYREKKEAK